MLHNYHTHTARCNHAQGEDRQYVEEAIKAGMKRLGFPTTRLTYIPCRPTTSRIGV